MKFVLKNGQTTSPVVNRRWLAAGGDKPVLKARDLMCRWEISERCFWSKRLRGETPPEFMSKPLRWRRETVERWEREQEAEKF